MNIVKDLEYEGLGKANIKMRRRCLSSQIFEIYREGETGYTARRKVTLHTHRRLCDVKRLLLSDQRKSEPTKEAEMMLLILSWAICTTVLTNLDFF